MSCEVISSDRSFDGAGPAGHVLAAFMEKVGRLPSLSLEKNLFSLGARGHYEKPVSDLLAFFLNPFEEHGFGTLFLDALVASSGISPDTVLVSPASFTSIRREVVTDDRKFIDLVVEGESWLILIENKIHSGQNNPFTDYEQYASGILRDRNLILLILSPHGSSKPGNWTPVTYKSLCAQVKERLSAALWSQPTNKWQIFAREFIIHLETLLYRQTMKTEEFQFVLDHLPEFRKARRLADGFLADLAEKLREELGKGGFTSVTTRMSYGWGVAENWAIRCTAQGWGASDIAFYTSAQEETTGFYMTLYAVAVTPEQIQIGHRLLGEICQTEYKTEQYRAVWSCWETTRRIETLDEAFALLGRLARAMNGILGVS